MRSDRDKWNCRYRQSDLVMPAPPPALIDNLHQLQPGNVLDVASGEGAVALYVAANPSFKVTALDISDVGLKNLKKIANDLQLDLKTLCLDLDNSTRMAQLSDYDCITLFRYKPTVKQVKQLISALAVNGRFILSTFNLQQHRVNGFSERFCLDDEEFLNVDARVELLSLSRSSQSPYTDTYIFQRVSADQ